MNSVRNRLAALFFVITAAAIGFVYLYVVPQLRSNLTAEKLDRLERVGTEERAGWPRMRRGSRARFAAWCGRRPADRCAVTCWRALGPAGAQPSSWSATRSSSAPRRCPSTRPPPRGGQRPVGSAVEEVDGKRTGEIAVPLSSGEGPLGRRSLDAARRRGRHRGPDQAADPDRGAIALAAALAAGWIVARAHAKRLSRLEAAAEKVAEGDFSTPIPDEGTDEVGQLASTFNEMQQRLARLDQARKEFIANASHELRTPIFSLGGFVELLDEEEPDPAVRAEFVRTMREQVARLTKLTADLLDLSKLDADVLEVSAERVDLGEPRAGGWQRSSGRRPSATGPRSRSTATGPPWPWPTPTGWRRSCVSCSTMRSRTRREGTSISITAQRRDGAARLVVERRRPRHRPTCARAGLRPLLHGRPRERLRARPGDRPRAGDADGRRAGARIAPGAHRVQLRLPAPRAEGAAA